MRAEWSGGGDIRIDTFRCTSGRDPSERLERRGRDSSPLNSRDYLLIP